MIDQKIIEAFQFAHAAGCSIYFYQNFVDENNDRAYSIITISRRNLSPAWSVSAHICYCFDAIEGQSYQDLDISCRLYLPGMPPQVPGNLENIASLPELITRLAGAVKWHATRLITGE